MNAPILEVSNLTKIFKGKKGDFKAVDNISFTISEGKIVGFLGPNGAGKTTTIYMLLGVLRPSSGKIEILGKDIIKNRLSVLDKINFSSSYIRLPGRLTVWENLYTFSLLYDIPNPKERIKEVIEIFEIKELKNTQSVYLSAGQTTRVMLAKAFLNKPRLVFLDEPTASLDPDIAVKVRQYILRLQKEENTAIFFTSHNMAEIEEVCDRVIILNKGKIVAEDSPEKLAARIKNSRLRLLIIDGRKRPIKLYQSLGYKSNESERDIIITLPSFKIAQFF